MIFVERFLLERGRRWLGGSGGKGGERLGLHGRRDAVQISSHQLQPGILEPGATVVHQRDPPIEIGLSLFPIDRQDVIGLPRKPSSQVGDLHFLFLRAAIVQHPEQRRAIVEILAAAPGSECSPD